MSWSAFAKRVRESDRPLGQRVNALHSLLANHHAPLGFEATRERLCDAVGVAHSGKWTDAQILQALLLLEESRRNHLAYRDAFASRRRGEKAAGRRQPTRGDLEALAEREWFKDAAAAVRRVPSRREQ
jgi:hypothetical protein